MLISWLMYGLYVRIEDNKLDFYFIFFYFPLIFSYCLLKEYKIKKTKYDIVTGHITWSQKSQAHMIQRRA